MEIPPSIIEMIPESVARENIIIPLAMEGDALKVAIAESELSLDGSDIQITKRGGATELIELAGSGLDVDSIFEFFVNLQNKVSQLASK